MASIGSGWDFDNTSADDLIGGYQLHLSAYTITGFPTTITLQSTCNQLTIELSVEWQ